MEPLNPNPAAYDHVLGLRVVRRYRPDPIGIDEMAAILESGRWTGSSKNRQGWAFIVIEDRAGLDRLAGAGDFTAPLLEAVAAVALVRTPDGNDFDIGRAAQDLMLAAAALGIGSCPITLHHRERAIEILGLPAAHECRWVVALGYPDREAEAAQREGSRALGFRGRKPLEDLIHRNRFGG